MLQFVISTWYSGLRARGFHAVFVFGLLLIGVAYLSGSFSPRHPNTVALDVGLSVIRFALVLLSLFWVQDMVGKEIDRRIVIFSLAYPVSRAAYIAGRFLGIQLLAALATVVFGLLLLAVIGAAGGIYEQQFPVSLGAPYWACLFGIWLDVAVVTAFALMIASLSTVAILPLALGAAFAIGARAFGAVRDYVALGAEGDQDVARLGPVLHLIHYLLPDLSRLDWRTWPMYQMPPGWELVSWALVMALTYIGLLLALATWAFSRREFS